jgi:hypothetical protein
MRLRGSLAPSRTPGRHRSFGRRLLVAAALAAGLAGAAGARQLEAPAGSPAEIRPLLLGSEVPAAEVRDLDGKPADLAQLVDGRKTMLVVYRGGW